MSVESLIASYLRIARQDLNDAVLLEAHGSRNAIYHCAQAAEKLIKALLISEGIQAGASHMLSELVAQIPDVNPLKVRLRALEGLTTYLTTYRYPNTWDQINKPPEGSKFTDFAQKAESLLTEAISHFGVDLNNKNLPAKTTKPIR